MKYSQTYLSFSESTYFWRGRWILFISSSFFFFNLFLFFCLSLIAELTTMCVHFLFEFSDKMLSPWENHVIILYLNYFSHRMEYFILQRSAQKMQHFNIFMVAAWESRGRKTILLSLFISVPDRRVQEYNWLENFQQHFVEIFIGYEMFQIKHFD